MAPPIEAIRDLLTDSYFQERKRTDKKRYIAFARSQGLKKSMAYLNSDDIQELKAKIEFRTDSSDIGTISNSPAANVFTGQITEGQLFEIDFTKMDHGTFPWSEIASVLGRSNTIYDIPIRDMVIRFSNESFHQDWIDTLKNAIEHPNPPLNWVDEQFYAIFRSRDPGSGDSRDEVKQAHEDFYYLPRAKSDGHHNGLGWEPRSLDLEAVYSHNAWTELQEEIFTSRLNGRQFDWTPRAIEDAVFNYFESDTDYTGILRENKFVTTWRGTYSLDMTSLKEFDWVADEEWEQTA